MWIWLALLDLKAHLLQGKSFTVLRGPILIPIIVAIAAVTAASFFLNAVFAFAIALPGSPDIRRGFTKARSHLRVVLGVGATHRTMPGNRDYLPSALGPLVVRRIAQHRHRRDDGRLHLRSSRLIGVEKAGSKRDQLSATVIGGSIGAVVCTPPYVLGRVGVLMLGSHVLFVAGIIVLILAVTLQAGATGAVKAVKMSADRSQVEPPRTKSGCQQYLRQQQCGTSRP